MTKSKSLRLPLIKDLQPGEQQNVTELTVIVPIRKGAYPWKKLRDEVIEAKRKEMESRGMPQDEIEVQVSDLEHKYKTRPESLPPMSWFEHLKRAMAVTHNHRQGKLRRMSTIHYARAAILAKDRLPGLTDNYLLFTSNFDGELYEYLEEFSVIDEGPLNNVFGHCVGWPGARPAEGFLRYVEENQFPAGFFYANYPRATVGEVNRAIAWKTETEKFIEKARLTLKKGQSSEQWAQDISDYLNDLAKPTHLN